MIGNTRYKILDYRKQKIYFNFTAFCTIGNN